MNSKIGILLAILCIIPTVGADTFIETFEDDAPGGLNPEYKPDENWYNYVEGDDVGNLTIAPVIPYGYVAFRVAKGITNDASTSYGRLSLERPTQITQINFTVRGTPINANGVGSQQLISLESSAPVRRLAEMYLFCKEFVHSTACELRVRSENTDTTGLNYTSTRYVTGLAQFNITLVPNWIDSNYVLTVNGVVLGTSIPFLDLPTDFARLTISQYREDTPMRVTFDNWRIEGGIAGNQSTVEGDAVEGIRQFIYDIHFRSAGSLFVFGIILFVIGMAAVIVPMFALGKSNAIANAVSFFGILLALWLVTLEIWPNWIGITFIILVAALVGLVVRRLFLGIRNASTGPGLIVGCFGYFIIASTFLGFSGYASDTITTPISQVDGDGAQSQSFVGAVAECIITGGAFTFGLVGDCNQATVSGTWKEITDIFSWVRTAINFLFQLLAFRLPIPVIFNMMIVLPPATALAVYAFELVRGK